MEHKGLRFNNGKLRYDLVHPWAHERMVNVLTKGANKYAPRNWENGMAWSNVISSLKRHLAAIEQGEDYDPESNELHAAHIACNAHFLTAYYKIYPQGDDRPHSYLNCPKIGLDVDEVICDWLGEWCRYWNINLPDSWFFDRDIINKINTMAYNMQLDDFYLNLKPLINPNDLPFEPYCYVTSRPVESSITEQWIDSNGFPSRPVITVPLGKSKVDVLKENNIDMFIDDRYENFVEINKSGICCFLMDMPHNRRYNVGYKRIYNFNDFKQRFL